MRRYDVLRLCESTLRMLEGNGINAKDVRYVEMFREYERLCKEGHKVTYVVEYLAQQYGCGVATVYRAMDRLGKEINY